MSTAKSIAEILLILGKVGFFVLVGAAVWRLFGDMGRTIRGDGKPIKIEVECHREDDEDDWWKGEAA